MTNTDIRGVTRAPGAQVWGPLVALWLIWGSTYLGIAVMGRSVPPLLGNGLRFAVAGVVLVIVIMATRGRRALVASRAEIRSMVVMGLGLLAVGIGTLSIAEQYVPSGIAALLVAVMPLWIILFRLKAGERPALLTLAGVAIGMGGLILMLLPGGTTPVSGSDRDVVIWSAAIIVSSFSWAFFSWRSAAYTLPSNPMVTTTYELLVAAVALTVVGAVRGERLDPHVVTASSVWAGLLLVAASILGYSAYTWLLSNAPMSLVSTYAYVNPVVAVLLGVLIIGEAFTSDVIVGLTVVVGGVVLVVSGERRK